MNPGRKKMHRRPFHRRITSIRLRKSTVLLAAAGLALFLFFVSQSSHPRVRQIVRPLGLLDSEDYCARFPDTGNVVITVKTGATEAQKLLPSLLANSLRCVKDPIIVSDLDQKIGGHHVHDVLADFTPELRDRNLEFDIYRRQQHFKAEGREKDIPSLADLPIREKNWRTKGKTAAWGLDKYKNIRMVELTWKLRPNKDWYLFIDADTYIVWDNLLTFLSTLDPTQPLYAGQPVRMNEHMPRPLDFAYGGSGILLSGTALGRLTSRGDLASRWDQRIRGWFFGDFILADAIDEELHLQVSDAKPMFGGDNPATTAYSSKNWCRPVITMHHMRSPDTEALLDVRRNTVSPILRLRDVYNGMFPNGLPKTRGNWDNIAGDESITLPIHQQLRDHAKSSFAGCEEVCVATKECFQFVFTETTDKGDEGAITLETDCWLSYIFRLGEAKAAEVIEGNELFSRTWSSGWYKERIDVWVQQHEQCTDEGLWELGPGLGPIQT